jgi:predicted SAM-dependent methyltransferase
MSEPLRLHIGGVEVKDGWKILNIQPGPGVDFVGSCIDLSQFADNAVTEVYASHVYEHLNFHDEAWRALREGFRVLKPGGLLRVGIPDLEALSKLFLKPGYDVAARFHLVRMFYGGQSDPFDYHKLGMNFQILEWYLKEVGFTGIRRVDRFGLFSDTTEMLFDGVPISLNVVAMKPVH